ncbi:ABC transporter related protein [Dehalogenimonas lykanthroporepellens BL-DC-9]|nr:ABC transporter related protein [Dehalogenimonas lykanthroporepellens BL-DC-9]
MSHIENEVKLCGLSKSFGCQEALKEVSLGIPKGAIFGLLGPNGAGKSTIISILLGLTRSTSGTFSLFDQQGNGKKLPGLLRQVGTVFEHPVFYPQLSGRLNLRLLAGAKITEVRIAELAEFVGLQGRLKDKVGTYSMGMKQRLALALALSGKPKLLILDEPTNGLDPIGIADLRLMIHQVHEVGTTILLASHMLTEVEKVCTDVAIMNKGQIAVQGKLSSLVAENGGSLEELFLSLLGRGGLR